MKAKILLLTLVLGFSSSACSRNNLKGNRPSPSGVYDVKFDVVVNRKTGESYDETGVVEFIKNGAVVNVDRWTFSGTNENFVSAFPSITWVEPNVMRLGVEPTELKGDDWLWVSNDLGENLKVVKVQTGCRTCEMFVIFDLTQGGVVHFRVDHLKRRAPNEVFLLAEPYPSFSAVGESGKEYSGLINIFGGIVNSGKVPPNVIYQMPINLDSAREIK